MGLDEVGRAKKVNKIKGFLILEILYVYHYNAKSDKVIWYNIHVRLRESRQPDNKKINNNNKARKGISK